jgi:hypothetical protein
MTAAGSRARLAGMTWQYRAIKLRINNPANLEKELNELGADGWELVTVRDDVLLLKRPAVISIG